MNIPKRLKIGGQKVKVIEKRLIDVDSEHSGGTADWERNEIVIASDMPQDRRECALLHEIIHMINVYLPEEEVTYLSEALYQVLHDNKLLSK